MKETGILTVKLFVICAVVAALLAFVNDVTAPIIQENAQKSFEAAMTEVLPDAQTFTAADLSAFVPSEGGVTVESAYRADGGYVVSALCGEGYGGDVSVMVGIDKDQTVAKVKIMSMSETPGLGAKATDAAFTDQYGGLNHGIAVVKGDATGENQISAISGATITSKAVTKCVNAALEATKWIETEGE